jgi:hypothetical protein
LTSVEDKFYRGREMIFARLTIERRVPVNDDFPNQVKLILSRRTGRYEGENQAADIILDTTFCESLTGALVRGVGVTYQESYYQIVLLFFATVHELFAEEVQGQVGAVLGDLRELIGERYQVAVACLPMEWGYIARTL